MPRPLRKLLGRFSVGHKLMLIYLMDLTAVIFISGILIHEKYIAIDFARKEIAGNAYIAAVVPALLAVAEQQSMQRRESLAVARPIAEDAERRYGDGMQTAALHRPFVQAVREANGALLSSSARSDILDYGRQLITRVGNQSNLILDPDLDSYYTMSLVLLRYPDLLELVWDADPPLQPASGTQQALDAAASSRLLMLEGQIDAITRGMESDAREAFAATADPQLQAKLGPLQSRLREAIDRYRGSMRQLTIAPRDAQRMAEVHLAQSQLVAALRTAWMASSEALERLIQTRIDGFFTRMWLHLGTALLLLMIILTAVFYVARQITLPLRRLSGVADTVRRTGDHDLRAEWSSSDEIGRLVVAFNDMLAQLDRERRVQQELAATARAADAQRHLVEAMPIPLVVTSIPDHQVLHANQPAQQWLGGRELDPWAQGLESPVRARFFQALADRNEVSEFEVHWHAGTEPTWAVLSARRMNYQGQDAVLTAFTPVNLMKAMEQRLELWAKVFEASSEAIVILDAERRVLSVNRAFCRATGRDQQEALAGSVDALLADSAGAQFLAELWPAVHANGSWQGEVQIRSRHNGSYPAWMVVSAVPDASGRLTHYILTSIDISDRKASEERIQFLAHHDVLTELPNRSLSIERLRLAMQQSRRRGDKVAVLFIDLDRFKNINDSLGHHVGDALLRSVAGRLMQAVREGDTVSRLGGDEFVVVLSGVSGAEEVLQVVERRLVPRIRLPHLVGGTELNVSCSVGVAMYPDDAQDLDELMRHADIAMYQAKASGRDQVHFFTSELNERAQQRLRIESMLRHAMERQELRLHYQPRVDARSGSLLGAEALLRWSPAEVGPVSPAQFIPIAEESGLIVPMGAWVIGETCRQIAAWRDQGLDPFTVSVNVSALQWREGGLLKALREALARHRVPPQLLELELTESALMINAEHTLAQMRALKELGVRLSIDDFGTGYSSLNYLNRFPIDMLKIDRSFVQDLLTDDKDHAITRAIIALGHTLGLRVVAEGVESENVAMALRQARCDELQGFHIGRPMPAGELSHWLLAQQAAA
jgi:diguanylate cyclase (GGDEF)-like protein/PAS domain S-box-containing protein